MRFPVYDFNNSPYDNARDQIILENSDSLLSRGKFVRHVGPAAAERNSSTMTSLANWRVISGKAAYALYLRPNKIKLEAITGGGDEDKYYSAELAALVMTGQIPQGFAHSSAFLSESSSAFPNMIPSIRLKEYLLSLQRQIDENKVEYVKRESNNNYKEVTFNAIELKDVMNSVPGLIDRISHCNVVYETVIQSSTLFSNVNGVFSYTTSKTVVPSRNRLVHISIEGKKHSVYIEDPIIIQNIGAKHPPLPKSSTPIASTNIVSPNVLTHIAQTTYEDGVSRLLRNNSKTEGYFKMVAVKTELTQSIPIWGRPPIVFNTLRYEVVNEENRAGYAEPTGEASKISENDALTDRQKDALYLIAQMLGRVKLATINIADLDNTLYQTDKGFKLTKLTNVSFKGEALEQALKSMEAGIKMYTDGYDDTLTEAAKKTSTGRLLKSSNYLEGLVGMNGVGDVSDLFLSWYIPLRDNVDRFEGEDKAISTGNWKALWAAHGKRIWDYCDIVVHSRPRAIWGAEYKIVGVVPNWYKLKSAPPRVFTAIVGTMMHVTQQPQKPKKNYIGAIFTTAIAIFVTVITLGKASPWAYAMVAAAWATAITTTIATTTGSAAWAKAAEISGYVSAILSFGKGLVVGLAKGALNSVAIQFALQLASMFIKQDQERKMAKLKNESKQLESEHRGIISIDDDIEINKKVEKFIFTEQYNNKYDYDKIYNEQQPKRV